MKGSLKNYKSRNSSMAKKKKAEKPVELGRWKKDPARRGAFVRRALSLTEAPPREIAERSGMQPSSVRVISRREGIRPRELTKAIAGRVIAEKQKGRKKKRRTEWIGFFKTEKEKLQAIENNADKIRNSVNYWWKKKLIRSLFDGKKEGFFGAAKFFVFEQLDYFNPETESRKGGKVKVGTWIQSTANLFCKRAFLDKKRAIEKEKSAMAIGAREKPSTTRSWIPPSARPLLKKLGLDPEKVADVGYKDIAARLKTIANNPETRLTKLQKNVFSQRLDGRQLRQIAKKLNKRAYSAIFAYEERAAAKVRKQLERL